YKQTFLQGFIRNYFNNSYKEMVNFFVQQKKLKSKDLQDIINMIENNKK
ncbi:MAG: BlaI/MecI/CopY family transcriptional regulator, partial [Parafilimonas sp.]